MSNYDYFWQIVQEDDSLQNNRTFAFYANVSYCKNKILESFYSENSAQPEGRSLVH